MENNNRHNIVKDHEEILNILDYLDGNQSDDMSNDNEDACDELNLLLGEITPDKEISDQDSVQNILRGSVLADEPSSSNEEPSSEDILEALSAYVHEAHMSEMDIDEDHDQSGNEPEPIEPQRIPQHQTYYTGFKKPLPPVEFKKIVYEQRNTTFHGSSVAPISVGTPYQYFEKFLGVDVFQMISDQSNLYAE